MAKNDYTAKFRVDISDLKKNIADARQQIKIANATFKAETAGMDKWEDSAEGVAAKLKQLKSVLESQKSILSDYEKQLERQEKAYAESGKAVDELKAKLKQLADNGVDKASDEYKQLEAELKTATKTHETTGKAVDDLRIKILNQQAVVKKTEKEVNDYTKSEKDLGDQSKDTSKDVDKLGDSTKRAGEDAQKGGDGFTVFKGVLSNLTTQVINKAIDGMKKLGKAIINTTLDAAQYADEINTMSKVTGIATDDLQAYSYAADIVDVSLETLTGAMAKNIKSMSNARNGSDKYVKAYEKLGVKITDVNGELRDSEDVFWEAIDALGQIKNETERDATAMQLFGKSAQDLNPLILAGSDNVKKLTKEAKDMGGVLSSKQLDKLNDLNDTMDKMKATAKNAKNAIGLVLLPSLQNLATAGQEWLGSFTKKMQEADGDVEKIGDAIGESISDIGDKILNAAPEVASAAGSLISTLGGKLLDGLPKILEVGRSIVTNLLNGIKEKVKSGEFAKKINENIPIIVKNLISLVSEIAKSAADIIVPLAKQIPTMIKTFITSLLDKENVSKLIDGLVDLVGALVDAQGEIIAGIINSIPDIIKKFFTEFLTETNINDIVNGAIKLVGKIVENSGKIIKAILDDIPNIIDSILDAFASLPSRMLGLGEEAGSKLTEGIKKAGRIGLGFLVGGIPGVIAAIAINNSENSGTPGALDKLNNSIQVAKGVVNPAKSVSGRYTMATGGIVNKATDITAGEDGAEAIIPLEHNTGWIKQVANKLAVAMKTQNTIFNGGNTLNNQKTVNFTQINNSPKALNRLDVYRDTQNMLALVKEGI